MKYSELPKWLQNIALLRKDHHIELSEDKHLTSLFVFGNTPEGATFWRNISSNKLPDPSTYVKVGDWIQITKGTNTWVPDMDDFVGKIVQIKEIKDSRTGNITIRIEDSHRYFWLEYGHFVKANPPANQSISPTEVDKGIVIGSRVKVNESKFYGSSYKGQIGVVTHISVNYEMSSIKYQVKWPDGMTHQYPNYQIELVIMIPNELTFGEGLQIGTKSETFTKEIFNINSNNKSTNNVRSKTIELQRVSPSILRGSPRGGRELRDSNSQIRLGT